jgi:lipopolysaccharide biosynthesis glycosyltransferase
MAATKPLLVASDERFLFATAAALRSIAARSAALDEIVVIAYLDRVPAPQEQRLAAYCRDELGLQLRIVHDDDLPPRSVAALDALEAALPSRPRAQNARLALCDALAGEFPRAVYTDVDIVAVGEIADLWDIDLEGNPVAAVREIGLVANRVPEVDAYFNSGVMLIDVDRWVEEEIGYEVMERMVENARWTTFDQDTLNLVLAEPDGSPRWRELPFGWNAATPYFMNRNRPLVEAAEARGELRIVHFTGELGPGMIRWHPYGPAFQEQLDPIPFAPPEPDWSRRSAPPFATTRRSWTQRGWGAVRRWLIRRRDQRRRPKDIVPGSRRRAASAGPDRGSPRYDAGGSGS